MTTDSTTQPCPGPEPRRTLKEHVQRRRALRVETAREIEELAARFHDQLPRNQAEAIGAIYARYSSRFQASIGDQVRTCFEDALRRKIFVPLEHVYFDLATRGAKREREGLAALQTTIDAKAVKVLLVLSTNRLHRKTHRALQFVEEEVVERGLRAIFVKTGIDTADVERWKLMMNFHAMMDEFVVSMYAGNVRAAHEGLFDRLMVFGTITFGYAGEPIPGEFTKQKKPRRRLVVDPVSSRGVVQIFHWFVDDRLKIDEIVRRLNADTHFPLSPRCLSGAWSHRALHHLLSNPRYTGFWEYGKTQTVWQSKKDYAKQELRDEPLRSAQVEELRIVPDALWHAAQVRLGEIAETAAGRRPLDGNHRTRPRLLNGLFYCPVHDRPLTVRGGQGYYLGCPECQVLPDEDRAIFSHLPRVLALQLTCRTLAERVRGDSDLVAAVISACQAEAARAQRPDLSELDDLHHRCDGLNRRITFVLRNGGESEDDQHEAEVTLKELRRERNTVRLAISRQEEARDRPVGVPTEDEVRSLLAELSTVLESAATGDLEQEVAEVRELVELLTGGRIDMEQQGERTQHRGWLRGRFQFRLLPYLVARASGAEPAGRNESDPVETIDYRAATKPEELADEVKRLADQDLLQHEIAEALGIGSKLAGKALNAWYARHDQERPDGRARRKQLRRKQSKMPRYVQLAEEVKQLRDSGLNATEVAAQLDIDQNMESKAWKHWHVSRGLVPPRASQSKTPRYVQLAEEVKQLRDSGLSPKEVAARLDCDHNMEQKAWKHWHTSRGLVPPQARKPRSMSGARAVAGESIESAS